METIPSLDSAWFAARGTLPVCRHRSGVKALLLLCAVLGLAACFGRTAAIAASPKQEATTHLGASANSSFAIADFDGDRQPDLATAEVERSDAHFTRYLIRLQLTSGRRPSGKLWQSIAVTGAFGVLQIAAVDVNGDSALDLVVSAAGETRPIAVLLNDGHGQFSVTKPSDFPVSIPDSPRRWGSELGQVQDSAVLIPSRTPQAEAKNENRLRVPRPPPESALSAERAFPADPLYSSPGGRAPPALV